MTDTNTRTLTLELTYAQHRELFAASPKIVPAPEPDSRLVWEGSKDLAGDVLKCYGVDKEGYVQLEITSEGYLRRNADELVVDALAMVRTAMALKGYAEPGDNLKGATCNTDSIVTAGESCLRHARAHLLQAIVVAQEANV